MSVTSLGTRAWALAKCEIIYLYYLNVKISSPINKKRSNPCLKFDCEDSKIKII